MSMLNNKNMNRNQRDYYRKNFSRILQVKLIGQLKKVIKN